MIAASEEVAEGLWDANDVGRYLKVSRSWIYARVQSGELPHRRIGALIRFEPDVIRAYARGEAKAASPVVLLGRPR